MKITVSNPEKFRDSNETVSFKSLKIGETFITTGATLAQVSTILVKVGKKSYARLSPLKDDYLGKHKWTLVDRVRKVRITDAGVTVVTE